MAVEYRMRRRIIHAAVAIALVGSGFAAGIAVAAQPHMEAALASLRQARSELERATANKGGHRVKAMELINNAIEEVRKGIAAAS